MTKKKMYPNKWNEHKMYTNNYDIIQTCDQAIKCTQISQTSIHSNFTATISCKLVQIC